MNELIRKSFSDYYKAVHKDKGMTEEQQHRLEEAYLSGMYDLNAAMLHNDDLRAAIVARMLELGVMDV